MRTIYQSLILTCCICMLSLTSCKDFLKEEVFSQLAPENYLRTKEGLTSLLYEAYAKAANMNSNNSIYVLGPQEFPTDILNQSGDSVEPTIKNYRDFNWDPTMDFLIQNWDPPYQCIRDANMVLENIPESALTDAEKKLYTAEARFLRAISYYKLYFFFGPVPLRTSTTQSVNLAKAEENTLKNFIETELKEATTDLPMPTNVQERYRAHKAAAMGYLIKFYLNTKKWNDVIVLSQTFLSTFNYTLFGEYMDMFKVENENNSEYIWVRPAIASTDRATANSWSNVSFPDNFKSSPETGIVFKSTWLNWPNEFRIYDAFYNSFEAGDKRKKLFMTVYINNANQTVSLLGNDNIRSVKYWPDQNNAGAAHGNDIPEIRLADIYLSRAEALNEVNGPTQDALDNINYVRRRANILDLKLVDITSKDQLRDLILAERGHEFYNEGHRRIDMIRMGKFISNAIARGKNARNIHLVFPIPQVVVDSDPLLKNTDY
ncbi:RagB/SusD family nutrient uptake outer membrane protein [Pedobacter chitinilyticus]|uniref:RagB/SusD family nutrient uptake outer membrane protein n=1 Tax=Pedobacter chitinilyticus TaxID=2233776 RepID=A0A3S3PPZ1_9SPHI|nr:RagB/SusD family nutrient uptake outer membrane protein [Pedobacter chitinilyticus]RWU10226.1 RagB/SusD family nutrient uptake outer membrane protein [Pedobacter chitinilyticus]